ncbi:MAG: hypothetical protein QF440_01725 [Candidatus Thalassarchaeaceae archaeon]|jgi:hypothetical protein|nr:hypothetical protein [Candidatus Thalassarchaeaceae archaeon]
MKRIFAICIALLLAVPFATAGNSGVNQTIDVSNTPISSISSPNSSSDGESVTVEVTLHAENGTTVQWTVQMCLNTGVCNPPEVLNMENSSSDSHWIGTITPVDDHSYVNYDIILNYADGESEKFPENGFTNGGKIWSDCWTDGDETGGEKCSEESSGLPAPTLMLTVIVGLSAALIAKRDD